MGIYSDVLLTVDFDRTLTGLDGQIPERNLEAIRYFMDNGGIFTVNTGRSVPMFRPHMDRVPTNAPFLLYNGSGAYNYEKRELELLRPIPLPMMETIQACMARFPDLNLEVQGLDAHYCFQEVGDWDAFCAYQGCTYAHAAEGTDYGPFLKFAMIGKLTKPTVASLFEGTAEEFARLDEAEAWLKERFGDAIEVFRAGPRIVDIHAHGVSKCRAARDLQAKLGRKILVCVGDAENDMTMLEGADYAFCPADGVVADRFDNVCNCDEGAVADVIYKKIPEILALHP